VVNKFDGDAMLAFFGTLPRLLSPKQSALAALESAAEMLDAIDRLNSQRRSRGEPQLITGIGIHTGVLIAGGLGTSDRIHYTIIGDTVNTTQRIENLTRETIDCSGILVSHSTYSALGEHLSRFGFEPLGFYQVKGKKEPLQVYRMIPPKQAITWEGTL
jgi:adenylate cyclase